MDPSIVVVTSDAIVAGKVRALAAALGDSCEVVDTLGEVGSASEPRAIVVDLGIEGAADAAASIRARWPRALIAGFVSLPDPQRWRAALEAGYNVVATRGTIAAQIRDTLETWAGPPSARRFRLFDAGDVVGRLGAVARMSDTPVGAIAVYQIGRALYAAGDSCPHAGARLSEGELEGTVITCPRHGSRFDVTTGERVRGPADDAIPMHRVVVEQGIAYLEY